MCACREVTLHQLFYVTFQHRQVSNAPWSRHVEHRHHGSHRLALGVGDAVGGRAGRRHAERQLPVPPAARPYRGPPLVTRIATGVRRGRRLRVRHAGPPVPSDPSTDATVGRRLPLPRPTRPRPPLCLLAPPTCMVPSPLPSINTPRPRLLFPTYLIASPSSSSTSRV